MSETVFILGAGASKQAGGPLMRDFLDVAESLKPEVGATFEPDFNLVFDGIAELRIAQSKARIDIDNLESVFAAFEMAALFGGLGGLSAEQTQRLAQAMRRVIARTLELRIRFIQTEGKYVPVPYQDFVNLVRKKWRADLQPATVSVMTFNYDIALDYMLDLTGIPIDYCLQPEPIPGSLELMKLHGSLNWGRCKQCKAIEPWPLAKIREIGFRAHAAEEPIVLEFLARLGERKHCHPEGKCEADPAIVPPTWNKTQHYGEIATVWRRAAKHLAEAKDIVVIGYSLPLTDQFFRYLYALGTVGRTRLRKFVVCNTDHSDALKRRYRRLLGQAARERFIFMGNDFQTAIVNLPAALARA